MKDQRRRRVNGTNWGVGGTDKLIEERFDGTNKLGVEQNKESVENSKELMGGAEVVIKFN